MVNIFARKITGDLASLVKQIDKVVADHQDEKMAAFLVLLSKNSDADERRLKLLAKKHGIVHVPLTIFEGMTGPPEYKISKEAEVTVLLWRERTVKVNHTFAKGKLNKNAIKEIVADTKKILE